MNKTAIKNFAIWARNKLIADISYRAGLMGITADGIHTALSQSTGQTEFYDIGTAEPYAITGEAIRQRRHLVELIQRKEKDTDYKTAYKYIIEEVAYTWFNRLIAVRFMEVNDYLPSHIRVLSSDTGKLEPDLVTTPFDAELEFTNAEQQAIIDLKNANKLDELFRLLFIKQCNALNEILPALFEKTNDYTELLLNLSVIDQDGVVYHLVHDISEEDFDVERGGQVEIIGWLYQYYNTEPKDETFALLKQNVKVTKERIPAATQLFTPDWIVRYMVENSVGRLWLNGHQNNSLKAEWKYYLEEVEQEPEVQTQLVDIQADNSKLNPEDIKVMDPCMGSGHILVYAFDVLMQIYESAGYGRRDAARSILENNIYGLDVDDRAFQMAYFAIIMKARQYNRRIMNEGIRTKLFSIQESNGINRQQLQYFGHNMTVEDKNAAILQITYLLDSFEGAKEFGSIISLDRLDYDLLFRFISNIETIGQLSFDVVGIDETQERLTKLIEQGACLSQKYNVVVTNPPYMSSSNMSAILAEYTKKKFPLSKADMSTVFMEKSMELCSNNGYMAMINIPVWMSLPTYDNFRESYFHKYTILNMSHNGRGIFGSDFGSTAFVLQNCYMPNYSGVYLQLFVEKGQVDSVEEKESMFLKRFREYRYKQSESFNIPGSPLAYWESPESINVFKHSKLGETLFAKTGLTTGNNDLFLRLWFEISQEKWNKKWFPMNKGGEYRKWYGNNYYVVNWENKGSDIKKFPGSTIRNEEFYFKEGATWSKITAGKFSARYSPATNMFDAVGLTCFSNGIIPVEYIVAFLCSCVAQKYVRILNQTVSYTVGTINNLPFIYDHEYSERIVSLARENIQISKDDWDSSETSWGFKASQLLNRGQNLRAVTEDWISECRLKASIIQKNEEELNRLFINIYGLDKELSPEIREEDITLTVPNAESIIKDLLSYAVGCMFGRYGLQKSGIIYAGGQWDINQYSLFLPDEDNVIPITDEEYLEDDIVSRFCDWMKKVFGEDSLEDNLDYIASIIGGKGDSSRERIRHYFVTSFYKDHCDKYSATGSGRRPIYWLFDSGKQNGFKALIYLHRYNADTIGNLRIDYLHRMQRVYESEISRMQDMIDHSTNAREVGQATKRRDKLTKQLKECREYDEKLAHLALSRIELDLDDGVKVNYRKLQTANDGKFYEVLADSKNIMAKK